MKVILILLAIIIYGLQSEDVSRGKVIEVEPAVNNEGIDQAQLKKKY
jgi:hypothetical protein